MLQQVLTEEPRPPSRFNDSVPKDLETICLKAIEKDPARRYQTASELAADLCRWLRAETDRRAAKEPLGQGHPVARATTAIGQLAGGHRRPGLHLFCRRDLAMVACRNASGDRP